MQFSTLTKLTGQISQNFDPDESLEIYIQRYNPSIAQGIPGFYHNFANLKFYIRLIQLTRIQCSDLDSENVETEIKNTISLADSVSYEVVEKLLKGRVARRFLSDFRKIIGNLKMKLILQLNYF